MNRVIKRGWAGTILVVFWFVAGCPTGVIATPLEWEQVCERGFGNLNNYSAFSVAEYDGALYVGTHNITEGCEIWRFDGPSMSDWTKVSLNGFGDSQNQIPYSMAVYQEKIYVGARNNSAEGFQIWSYDGTSWTFVINALTLGDGDLKIPCAMYIFEGNLILGAGNSWTGNKATVFSFNGTSWVQINTASFGDSQNRQCRSLSEYEGELYVGTSNSQGGGQLWRYDGPTSNDWTAVATNGFGIGNENQDTRSLNVYDGKLYAGTANVATGCQIWESSNGIDWARNDPGTNLYFDATRVMITYGTNLFVGTGNALGAGGNDPGAQVWQYTGGTDWNQINENGFGFTNSAGGHSHMAVQFLFAKDGYLYAGASDSWNNGASVWRTWVGLAPFHPPVASPDVTSTPEDTVVVIDVLANDTDEDNDVLTVSNVTQGTNGAVVINGDITTVTYTPTLDYNGADSFTYTVSDNHGMSDTGTVFVTVTPVNDSPEAGDDAGTTMEDTAVVINVLTNDTDIDSVSLAIAGVTSGSNGTVVISGGGTNVTYTPDIDWNGTDRFTYTVGDWYGGFDTGTVDVFVTPVNDAPLVSLIDPADGSISWLGRNINLMASSSDVDGTVIRVEFFVDGVLIGQAVDIPWQASAVLSHTGSYSMTAKAWDDSAAVSTSTVVQVTVPVDYDDDAIADRWEVLYGLSPTNLLDATGNPDGDFFDNVSEYIADTDPKNSNDFFYITGLDGSTVRFDSSSNRLYTLYSRNHLLSDNWNEEPGSHMGVGGADSMESTNNLPVEFYKLTVELP